MTKDLATQADFPTHKLTVKLEDGRFKVFFCTTAQAIVIRNGINGADKFICLPKDIDKDAPSFYPKYGAWLEKIPAEEMKARREKYERSLDKHVEEKVEEKKKFESAKVDTWIAANPDAWEEQRKAAFVKLKSTPLFNAASEIVQSVLIRMEARRIVHDQITKPTP